MERQYYLWTAGGSTVSVAFAADVMTRLREAACTGETAEIGGFLLGRRESDDRITIDDFELFPSEHRRGMTFTLSQSDRKRLGQRLRASHNGLQAVGSFRTHLRQGLYMDQYDFDLMSAQFAAPSDVMLLIRPHDWQAGLFAWEEGDIHRQKSYREFCFDPAVLPMTVLATEPLIGFDAPPPPQEPRPSVVHNTPPAPAAPLLPTLGKVGLVTATLGLAGVLAFYAHEHYAPTSVLAKSEIVQPQPAYHQSVTPPDVDVHAPVDPDLRHGDADLSEMHVKMPPLSSRPSPFAPARREKQTEPSAIPRQAQPGTENTAQLPTPPAPPPIQSAVNLPPPMVAPLILTPPRLPLVSVVSVEPAEPGLLSRGINHVPVLNLLQRHNYKAGDKFSPARPVRRVKPRLPTELEHGEAPPSPVDVKVWIDKSGQVTKAELLSDNSDPEVSDIAANAALKWTFEPARLSDRPVSSEMVMHFRFAPQQP